MSELSMTDGEVEKVGDDLSLIALLDGEKFLSAMRMTAQAMGVRYGAIVLVGDDGLSFLSKEGFPEAATPRAGAWWDAAMTTEETFVVDDLLRDPRFANDVPHVVGGVPVRFFASHVFHGVDGRPIGVACVADPEPAELGDFQREGLDKIGAWLDHEIFATKELDRAAEVQQGLLPQEPPPIDGYEVAGICMPARAVGGDFYDWYVIDGGMAFTLADVMGKGIGASIIAATVRATIRSAQRNRDVVAAVDRAAETLEDDLSEAASFVTLFHARLWASTGRISFVDAGHGLTVVLDAAGTAQRLSTTDLPLGTSFGDGFQRQRIVLKPGGTLVSFSDGVLDLYDGTLASVDRVADIARTAGSAQEIVDEIERLARRDAASDDITVIAIRRLSS